MPLLLISTIAPLSGLNGMSLQEADCDNAPPSFSIIALHRNEFANSGLSGNSSWDRYSRLLIMECAIWESSAMVDAQYPQCGQRCTQASIVDLSISGGRVSRSGGPKVFVLPIPTCSLFLPQTPQVISFSRDDSIRMLKYYITPNFAG